MRTRTWSSSRARTGSFCRRAEVRLVPRPTESPRTPNGLNVISLRHLTLRRLDSALPGLDILDHGCPTQVEVVLACADVPGAPTLPAGDVCEPVFDVGSFPELVAASGRGELLAEALLQLLVLRDRDASPLAEFRSGALRAKWTVVANVGVELGARAQLEVDHLACGASDRANPQVELEGRLRKQLLVLRVPWLADDLALASQNVVDDGAIDVGSVDEQLVDLAVLSVDIRLQRGGGLFLGAIGWRHRAGKNQVAINVGGDVLLVAVEPLGLALAAVPHLRIFDRDAAVLGYAVADSHSASARIRFKVLTSDLLERLHVHFERRLPQLVRQVLPQPLLKRVELHGQDLDSLRLLGGVVPVQVETRLDARLEEQRNARSSADLRFGPPEKLRGAVDNLSGSVPQQVECVLDSAGTFERLRIDGDAQHARQLAPVEFLRPSGDLDRTLEQSSVHVRADEPRAEIGESPLREGRLGRAQDVEHHLDTQIDHRQLVESHAAPTEISLNKRRHCHQSWSHRIFAGAGIAVHGFELVLKGIIDQHVTVAPEKREELPDTRHALDDRGLLFGQFLSRTPALDRHELSPSASRSSQRRPADHGPIPLSIFEKRRCASDRSHSSV